MSASKGDSVPCFQCLRKVVCDGADLESMCSMEIGSKKHCDQCPSDQDCDPLPLCFLTMAKNLRRSKNDKTGFESSFERQISDLKKCIIRDWDGAVAHSYGGDLHDMAIFIETCRDSMNEDDFRRLMEIPHIDYVICQGLFWVREKAFEIEEADRAALKARMKARMKTPIAALMKERVEEKS